MTFLLLLANLWLSRVEAGMAAPAYQTREAATREYKKFWPLLLGWADPFRPLRQTNPEVRDRSYRAVGPRVTDLWEILSTPAGRKAFRVLSSDGPWLGLWDMAGESDGAEVRAAVKTLATHYKITAFYTRSDGVRVYYTFGWDTPSAEFTRCALSRYWLVSPDDITMFEYGYSPGYIIRGFMDDLRTLQTSYRSLINDPCNLARHGGG